MYSEAMTTKERSDYFYEVVNPKLDQLARQICEASAIDDRVLEDCRYEDLLAYYREQTKLGYWHPGLTETVADFTAVHDPNGALPLYRLALEQTRKLELHSYSVLIAMSEALLESGQREQAEACLRDGRAEAFQAGDTECVEQADRVLREMSSS